jgi:hypothetical protein
MTIFPATDRASRITAIAVLALTTTVFWRTAYPTITWWDSSSYSLAAGTLGVNSPPGSLLLTLLGWPVARLSFGTSPAHALNLFAGLLAAICAALVCTVALRMRRLSRSIGHTVRGTTSRMTAVGAGLGALTFAFSTTPWAYATKFTPYVLSGAFTGLILRTMMRWWENADHADAWRCLAWLGVLFGVDFSVHRTNALLIPGAIVWILVRSPNTLRSARMVLAGAGGLVAGLTVQMLLIPIAAFTRSPLNFSEPGDLSRFWDYVTIKQLGGSFLLQLFPRKSPIVSVQAADLTRVLGENFLYWSGHAGVLGALPAIAALIGLVTLWRGNRRLAVAFAVLLLIQASLTVLYFNIPANYFRTFDRHYLPVCVTIAVLVAYGLAAATQWSAALMRERKWSASLAIMVLAVSVPTAQLAANWTTQDASKRYFTRDYAANALRSLPLNAIYFTVGDNDTFPVMYLQSVEGVRPDVTIVNLSVANIPEWPDQLKRRDPSMPLALSLDQRRALSQRPWTDTSMVVPVPAAPEHFGLPPGTQTLPAFTLDVRPAQGARMLPAEIMLLDIVRTNGWKRPLTFAITGTRSAMEWLAPYGRLDGLYYRIVPILDPPANANILRANLLGIAQYRGYADPDVRIDDVSHTLGTAPYAGLAELLQADRARGLSDQCRADREALLVKLPLHRLQPPSELRDPIGSACAQAK